MYLILLNRKTYWKDAFKWNKKRTVRPLYIGSRMVDQIPRIYASLIAARQTPLLCEINHPQIRLLGVLRYNSTYITIHDCVHTDNLDLVTNFEF